MPIKKKAECLPPDEILAEGFFCNEHGILNQLQQAQTLEFGRKLQLLQESYLLKHPEVAAMLKIFLVKLLHTRPNRNAVQSLAQHFTRPQPELEAEVRQYLKLGPDEPFTGPTYEYGDLDLIHEMEDVLGKKGQVKTEQEKLRLKREPSLESREKKVTEEPEWEKLWIKKEPPLESEYTSTKSSSFASLITSETTVPTPEPIPTPEPTFSEQMFEMVSNAVDKAIFFNVHEQELLYDFAYCELKLAVEEAMEIPVEDLKVELLEMLWHAYKKFEAVIDRKEQRLAEIAYENRVRKPVKKSLRAEKNFKGYETPPPSLPPSTTMLTEGTTEATTTVSPTPTSVRLYKPAPAKYNRYDKNSFNVYRAGEPGETRSLTVKPDIPRTTIRTDEEEASSDSD